MIHILWSIIVGFIVGWIAKKIMPGVEHLGFILTSLLGIGGSIDRSTLFETGARLFVSRGGIHHVHHWRTDSALYLD